MEIPPERRAIGRTNATGDGMMEGLRFEEARGLVVPFRGYGVR
jgi:hypothetical protein